jgi:2-octaprenyl-6-methoxyphenol hydroxylase
VAALGEAVWRSQTPTGFDPAAACTRYGRHRRADVYTRTAAVDLLNRSLLSNLLPAQLARGIGLHLANVVGPLRRALMREGVAPHFGLPRLMRGLPLTTGEAE